MQQHASDNDQDINFVSATTEEDDGGDGEGKEEARLRVQQQQHRRPALRQTANTMKVGLSTTIYHHPSQFCTHWRHAQESSAWDSLIHSSSYSWHVFLASCAKKRGGGRRGKSSTFQLLLVVRRRTQKLQIHPIRDSSLHFQCLLESEASKSYPSQSVAAAAVRPTA